jgi:orotate phosphoribosyltransferase
MSKEYIARYIRKNCLLHPPKGEFFFGKLPGARYSGQYYLSNILYNREMMWEISKEFVKLVKEHIGHFEFQLTGREWSSIPLLSGLPLAVEVLEGERINSFMIKRNRKTYGIHNYVEGIPNDLPVLIVDDVCNSTDSFVHCHKIVTSDEMNLQSLPFIFSVLNKYSYAKMEPEDREYRTDRYLGQNFRALSIVDRDDIINAS